MTTEPDDHEADDEDHIERSTNAVASRSSTGEVHVDKSISTRKESGDWFKVHWPHRTPSWQDVAAAMNRLGEQ
jgi:hypothetical protein